MRLQYDLGTIKEAGRVGGVIIKCWFVSVEVACYRVVDDIIPSQQHQEMHSSEAGDWLLQAFHISQPRGEE